MICCSMRTVALCQENQLGVFSGSRFQLEVDGIGFACVSGVVGLISGAEDYGRFVYDTTLHWLCSNSVCGYYYVDSFSIDSIDSIGEL